MASAHEIIKVHKKWLVDRLIDPMFAFLETLYSAAKKRNPSQPLREFQLLLKEVPNWGQDLVEIETERVIGYMKLSENSIAATIRTIFINSTNMLSSLRTKASSSDRIKLNIPTAKTFLTEVRRDISSFAYNNPALFNDKLDTMKRTKNRAKVKKRIKTCISTTIRRLLPIQDIAIATSVIKEEEPTETIVESVDSNVDVDDTIDEAPHEELNEESMDDSPLDEAPPPVDESTEATEDESDDKSDDKSDDDDDDVSSEMNTKTLFDELSSNGKKDEIRVSMSEQEGSKKKTFSFF